MGTRFQRILATFAIILDDFSPKEGIDRYLF